MKPVYSFYVDMKYMLLPYRKYYCHIIHLYHLSVISHFAKTVLGKLCNINDQKLQMTRNCKCFSESGILQNA